MTYLYGGLSKGKMKSDCLSMNNIGPVLMGI